MTSLIQHVHDFARENELTVDEWMAGVQLLNWAGRMSDEKRNEGQLVCDVIGLESYYSFSSTYTYIYLQTTTNKHTDSSTKSPSN